VLRVRCCCYPESSKLREKCSICNIQAVSKPTVSPDKVINKIRETLLFILIRSSHIHQKPPFSETLVFRHGEEKMAPIGVLTLTSLNIGAKLLQ